jgi:hypothetical protein
MKTAFLIFVCALISILSFAMDLSEMLETAVENDAKLKVLNATLDNTLLGIERARLAPGRNLELSTGDIQTAYSFNPRAGDPEWLITAKPSAALLLGRKSETEVTAELPMGIGFGNIQEFTILPSVAVRQPVDKLFHGEKFTETQKIENRFAAERSRIDIVKRVKEIEQNLLEQLSKLTALQQQTAGLNRELAVARNTRQEALTLQTYSPDSAQMRQLEFTVSRLERQVELVQKKSGLAWKDLERIIGEPVAELPADLPDLALELPDSTAADRNPDVYLASLAVEVEKARLEEQRQPVKPSFFLGSAVGTTYDEYKEETTTRLAGTVEGEFEDFKFTAGVGGILQTRSVFVTFGFSWSFPDKEIENLNLKEQENFLEISRWNMSTALTAYNQNRELLAIEVSELGYRKNNLEEAMTLAVLELEEGRKSRQAGLITDQELDDLEWEVDKLKLEASLLQLDRLLAVSRVDALTALETQNQ